MEDKNYFSRPVCTDMFGSTQSSVIRSSLPGTGRASFSWEILCV